MTVFINMLGVLAFAVLVLCLMGFVCKAVDWITCKTKAFFRSHRK